MSQQQPALGFDVGGQSIKAALVSPAGEMLGQASAPTGEKTTADQLTDSLAALREELCVATPAPSGPSGLGFAGAIDRSGVVRGSPHLPLLVGSRIGELAAKRLGNPVVVRNDADCAAMAEGWGGAADGVDDFLLITLGTGVGSGLVLGGELRAGASGQGCELGHMMVVCGGRRCGCGNLGCLEAYISETGARGLVEESDQGLRSRVHERRSRSGGGYAEAVFELGAGGDRKAEEVATGMVTVLGGAIASTINVLDLTMVVLGGGIAPAVLAREQLLREAVAANLFARKVGDVRLVPATRGPLAGAIGAARLGMLEAARLG